MHAALLWPMEDKHNDRRIKKTAARTKSVTSSAVRKTGSGREPNAPDDLTWRLKLVRVLTSFLDLKRQTMTSEKSPSIRWFVLSVASGGTGGSGGSGGTSRPF